MKDYSKKSMAQDTTSALKPYRRAASSYGMKDRKAGRKKGVNCSTGKYSTK